MVFRSSLSTSLDAFRLYEKQWDIVGEKKKVETNIVSYGEPLKEIPRPGTPLYCNLKESFPFGAQTYAPVVVIGQDYRSPGERDPYMICFLTDTDGTIKASRKMEAEGLLLIDSRYFEESKTLLKEIGNKYGDRCMVIVRLHQLYAKPVESVVDTEGHWE